MYILLGSKGRFNAVTETFTSMLASKDSTERDGRYLGRNAVSMRKLSCKNPTFQMVQASNVLEDYKHHCNPYPLNMAMIIKNLIGSLLQFPYFKSKISCSQFISLTNSNFKKKGTAIHSKQD